MRNLAGIIILLMALTAGIAGADYTNAGQGCLRVPVPDNPDLGFIDLPLKHTEVDVRISGFIARVNVTQQFQNTQNRTLEAVYVFPLPDNSAVDAMTMRIGETVIKGIIKKREEAQQIYNQARANGQTAALLTQERPNIFTQAVANILPGDTIDITISYVQDLKYDDGGYELNFPMVVGPRFIPGQPTGRSGGGWSPDTDRVPDASRITPPVLRPGTRSGHDIAITVHLDAGVPVIDLRSPSHTIDKRWITDHEATVELDTADSIPNKDFILRYDVAGDLPASSILTHADERGGFFSLMIQPQGEFDITEVTAKEMVFVVDCSGSMSGAPMAQAKALMRKAIQEMNPRDSFQIIRFSSSASQFSPHPVPNTRANVRHGLSYINAMSGGGGTQMIEGIKAALDYPVSRDRIRIVLFLTDGYIGNETEILAAIEKKLNGARLFSLGVGSSVNHYLLDRMSEAGRGFVQYVRPDEGTETPVSLFYDRIRNPLITDIRIDWNGLDIHDVYPPMIPDLFSAQPVIIHGRYTRPGYGTVTIHGNFNGAAWSQEIELDLPEDEPENDVLAPLWARTRIKDLMARMVRGSRPDIVTEITDLALKYRLMSQYTAFVAVTEEVRRDPNGTLHTVHVPVEMPEMVEYEGVFGDEMDCEVKMKKLCAAPPRTRNQKGIVARTVQSLCGGLAAPKEECLSEPSVQTADCDDIVISGERFRSNDKPHGREEACKMKKDVSSRFSIDVRMISGNLTEETVGDILDTLTERLTRAINRKSPGTVSCRITVDENGRVTRVEILRNSYGEIRIEDDLKHLLKQVVFSGEGPGETVIELVTR